MSTSTNESQCETKGPRASLDKDHALISAQLQHCRSNEQLMALDRTRKIVQARSKTVVDEIEDIASSSNFNHSELPGLLLAVGAARSIRRCMLITFSKINNHLLVGLPLSELAGENPSSFIEEHTWLDFFDILSIRIDEMQAKAKKREVKSSQLQESDYIALLAGMPIDEPLSLVLGRIMPGYQAAPDVDSFLRKRLTDNIRRNKKAEAQCEKQVEWIKVQTDTIKPRAEKIVELELMPNEDVPGLRQELTSSQTTTLLHIKKIEEQAEEIRKLRQENKELKRKLGSQAEGERNLRHKLTTTQTLSQHQASELTALKARSNAAQSLYEEFLAQARKVRHDGRLDHKTRELFRDLCKIVEKLQD